MARRCQLAVPRRLRACARASCAGGGPPPLGAAMGPSIRQRKHVYRHLTRATNATSPSARMSSRMGMTRGLLAHQLPIPAPIVPRTAAECPVALSPTVESRRWGQPDHRFHYTPTAGRAQATLRLGVSRNISAGPAPHLRVTGLRRGGRSGPGPAPPPAKETSVKGYRFGSVAQVTK